MFQGGPFVELLSLHGSKPLESWQIIHGSHYLASPEDVNDCQGGKVYERDLKGYCFVCKGSTRLQFPPKSTKISLIHHYFVVQTNVPQSHNFSIEFSILDDSGSSRRIVLSSVVKSKKLTPLQVSIPLNLDNYYDTWINLVVDLNSLSLASFKQNLASTTSVSLGGPQVKVRKVFTAKEKPDIDSIKVGNRSVLMFSKTLDFPETLVTKTLLIDMDKEIEKLKIPQIKPQTVEKDQEENGLKFRPTKLVLTRPKSIIPKEPLPKYFKPATKQVTTQLSQEKQKPKKSRVPQFTPSKPKKKAIVEGGCKKQTSTEAQNEPAEINVPKSHKESLEKLQEIFIESTEIENEQNDEEISHIIAGSQHLISTASKLLEDLKLEASEYLNEEEDEE